MLIRKEAGFPDGHFHSPVADTAHVGARRKEIWRALPRGTLGIDDWNAASHRQMLTGFLPRWLGQWDYSETFDEERAPGLFYTRNSQLDSRRLVVLSAPVSTAPHDRGPVGGIPACGHIPGIPIVQCMICGLRRAHPNEIPRTGAGTPQTREREKWRRVGILMDSE
jgi:hypothetical protein